MADLRETQDSIRRRIGFAWAASTAIAVVAAVAVSCSKPYSATDSPLDAGDAAALVPTEAGADGATADANVPPRLYVVGGVTPTSDGASLFQQAVRSATILADGGLGTWEDEPPLPEPRAGHSLVAGGGKLYALGGTKGLGLSDTVYAASVGKDGRLSGWNNVAVVPVGADSAATSDGRFIHLIGGTRVADAHDSRVDYADVQAGQDPVFATTSPLSLGRAQFAAARTGTQLFAIGGTIEDAGPTSSVEIARVGSDGKLTGWNDTAPLPIPVFDEAAVTVGEQIFVLGGFILNPSGLVFQATVTSAGVVTWRPATSMPSPRYGLCATTAAGLIFAIGGRFDVGGSSVKQQDLAEVLVAKVNTQGVLGSWAKVTNYPIPITKAGCAAF